MAEISWTDEAAHWLKDIHDYIAEDNPKAAGRVVESIYQKAQFCQMLRLAWTRHGHGAPCSCHYGRTIVTCINLHNLVYTSHYEGGQDTDK